MSTDSPFDFAPNLRRAAEELAALIRARFPNAQFGLSRGQDDPDAIHLNAMVDVDDTDIVLDLVIDRMIELQIDEGLPIFVIPRRPVERVAELLQGQQRTGRRRLASTVPTLDRGHVLTD